MTAPVLRVPDDQLDFNEDLIFFYKRQRFTGIAYDQAPGHGLSEIVYQNGMQDGPARDWYPSGQLKSEENFWHNSRHGMSREFREDGLLESQSVYEFGVHMRSSSFDEAGKETVTFLLSEDDPNCQILQRLREQFGANPG